MKIATTLPLAAALLVGVSLAATAASDTGAARRARTEATAAAKALAKHRPDKAVAAAEAAVAFAPTDAGYRTLLGQAYLASGRFVSAAGALSDALSLDPNDGSAALHLALAQIANGHWDAARTTLNSHETTIPASDRGLAIALAGDPATAVTLLTDAARTPGADAKTRQNLALALALAGRWPEAKVVAAVDVSPAEVDSRIMQWAVFAKPAGAADQVAMLLGVTPIQDGGQPERLALRTTTPTLAAVSQPVPAAETYVAAALAAVPAALAEAVTVPIPVAVPAPVAVPPVTRNVAVTTAKAVFAGITVPAAARPPRATVAKIVAPVAPRSFAKGSFYVQLGAYQSAGVAHDAWGRMTRRNGTLARMAPAGAPVKAGNANFYRLSVGGFARPDADSLCASVRTHGGRCFVRAAAGDAVAAWNRGGVQLASR